MNERISMLTQFLTQSPNDAFARYGLAMEYAKLGEVQTAMEQFDRLLQIHPDYSAGYFMAAQTLAKAARYDEARLYLENGIAAAARTGNRHAQVEMQAFLEELV